MPRGLKPAVYSVAFVASAAAESRALSKLLLAAEFLRSLY
jgi:hypothetical protein